jgi:hypothetical protein
MNRMTLLGLKGLVTLVLCAGCGGGRHVVIGPERVSSENDAGWIIRSAPAPAAPAPSTPASPPAAGQISPPAPPP